MQTTLNSAPPIHHYAIIVAGGSGTRMQAAMPKQFLLLNNKPVLMHTIAAFSNCKAQPQIILVLNADYHAYWVQLCIDHDFTVAHTLVAGGETRFHSVKKGIAAVADEDPNAVIAVHDAVRPLVATAIIDAAYNYAAQHGNAITAVKSRDSIRQGNNNHSVSLLRDEIYLVQTPQTFKYEQLKRAYEQHYNSGFTDDASVVEQSGVNINLIAGSYRNIKITFPEDIAIAEMLLKGL
jgi:2-C-methyl-D-erythritol 4-phosphate cytidylyltransferase